MKAGVLRPRLAGILLKDKGRGDEPVRGPQSPEYSQPVVSGDRSLRWPCWDPSQLLGGEPVEGEVR